MNSLTPDLLAQLYAQESSDPFLILLTLSHDSFSSNILLVNNSTSIVSRGLTFTGYPFKVRFPVDDGESAREFVIEMDNVGLNLIPSIRSVTTQIGVKLELILASMPDVVQITQTDLKIVNIQYTATKINARIVVDGFLNTEMTSERYTPGNFKGLF